jgi:hypothetical protein
MGDLWTCQAMRVFRCSTCFATGWIWRNEEGL